MDEQVLQIRLRLIIIKDGKLLTEYNSKKDFCFYVGGILDMGKQFWKDVKGKLRKNVVRVPL
jgi:hypothetical protein